MAKLDVVRISPLTEEMKMRLRALAMRDEKFVAEVIRDAIVDYITKREEEAAV